MPAQKLPFTHNNGDFGAHRTGSAPRFGQCEKVPGW